MKIHEYQARELLAESGVPVPSSQVVDSVEAATDAFHKIGGRVVVKAQ
ncbi:MAG: acetate--CoA ligase family protein, partial [Planctomycetes bacterium]|nr:acetate--CoA ligase family protein [Planctomycetota bacterium]